MKIGIIGSGNGAITAAVQFANQDHDVSLFCREKSISKFDSAFENGGWGFNEEEKERCFVPFTNIYSDIEKVMDKSDIILVVVPSTYLDFYIEQMAPYLTDNMLVLFNGAASMGIIRTLYYLEKHEFKKYPDFAEVNTLSYGTRVDFNKAEINLSLNVKKLFLSAYPKEKEKEILSLSRQLYSSAVLSESYWRTQLENGNPEVHPAPTLLNVGRIDYSGGNFSLYTEGITEHTIKLLLAVEEERMAIGKALNLDLETAKESRIQRGYLSSDSRQYDLQTLFNTSPVFTRIKGPEQVESRYLTEDIAYGLVLWSSMAQNLGVKTPNINAIITIAGTILDIDFFEEGLTLEKLGDVYKRF